MQNLSFADAHTVGTRGTASWQLDYHDFLDDFIDNVGNDSAMTKLEDITGAVFSNKSKLLGQLVAGLIETKYGELLDQEYCDCKRCNKRLKSLEKRSRKLETRVGEFELSRPYFYCRNCHLGWFPLDDVLSLSDSPKQYDIQDIEAYLSSEMPYETAKEAYQRITGDKLSTHHMHDTTNAIGEQAGVLDVCPGKEELDEKIGQLSQGRHRRPVMMLGIDGAHGPMRPEPTPHPRKGKRGKGEWKEIKGFRLYLIDSQEIIHLMSWHQVCTDQELARDLLTIKKAGLIPEDRVRLGIIGDGAPWIWNRCKELFPQAKVILDYYHCSEHIHEVANDHYGKGTRQAQEWTEATLTRIYYGQMQNVLTGLHSMVPKTEELREKIVKLSNYLSDHTEKTRYASVKRAGYHIGSGAIESSNKFISNTRLKRSGAWWYIDNANNMLKIRCAKYNGTYDKIVKNYKAADQERIKSKLSKRKLRLVK